MQGKRIQLTVLTCAQCGATFSTYPSKVHAGRRFCSRPCYRRNRVGRELSQPRPVTPLEDRFWSKVDKAGPTLRAELGPCWVWAGNTDADGYGFIGRGRKGEPNVRAHRLAWELANGPIPDGLFVCHHCDNPPCVNVAHLFLGTVGDNTRDMARKGRDAWRDYRRGAATTRTRLTLEQVVQIRARFATGTPQPKLAAEYGVSRGYVSNLVRGVSWKHALT